MTIPKSLRETIEPYWPHLRLRLKCLWLRLKSFFVFTHYLAYQRFRAENPPVFIVGCGHSGTSLLLAVLGCHSKLCAIPQESCIAYDYLGRKPGLNADADLLLKYFDLQAISEKKMR